MNLVCLSEDLSFSLCSLALSVYLSSSLPLSLSLLGLTFSSPNISVSLSLPLSSLSLSSLPPPLSLSDQTPIVIIPVTCSVCSFSHLLSLDLYPFSPLSLLGTMEDGPSAQTLQSDQNTPSKWHKMLHRTPCVLLWSAWQIVKPRSGTCVAVPALE